MATCKWLTVCVPTDIKKTYFVPGTPVHEKDVPINVLFASNMRDARSDTNRRFSLSLTHAFAIIEESPPNETGHTYRKVLEIASSVKSASDARRFWTSAGSGWSTIRVVRGPIRWDVQVSDGDFQGQS